MLQRISGLFFITAALLFSPAAFPASHSIQVQLKENARVNPGKIYLKDIASLQYADADWVEKFENTPIADAPEFGKIKTFSRRQVDTFLRSSLQDVPEIHFTGANIVRLRTRGRPARREEIVPVLKSYIMDTGPWQEKEIEIGSIKDLDEIELPLGEIELRISSKSPIIGRGKMLAAIDVIGSGKTLRRQWVTAEVCVRAAILKARKDIPYRKVLTPDDIVRVVDKIEKPQADYLRNPENVIGKASKRIFAAGDPLTREDFDKPFLVHSGDIVNLKMERKGLVLTSLVRAEQDGRLGQVIRIRHLEFSSILKATVTGRDQVEMP